MNIKTFIYMILTFRRVDPIPKNIGTYVKYNVLDIYSMDNIQLCYIDNEINKIDKMKQGDVI